MSKDILGNKIADTSVSIPKEEYEALLREPETLRIITDLFKKDTFMHEHTAKVILGLSGNAEVVNTDKFNVEPPKEGTGNGC